MTPREIAAEFGLPVKELLQHGESDPDGLGECALVAGNMAGHKDRKAGRRTVQLCPPEFEPGSPAAVVWRLAYDCAFHVVPKNL